MNTICGRVVA